MASCHNLKHLHVYWGPGCEALGISCIEALMAGCPLLEDVRLNLTIEGLPCLAKGCPTLKNVTVIFNSTSRHINHFFYDDQYQEAAECKEFKALYPHFVLKSVEVYDDD